MCQVTEDGAPICSLPWPGAGGGVLLCALVGRLSCIVLPPVTNDGCGRTTALGLYSGSTQPNGGVLNLCGGARNTRACATRQGQARQC